MTSILSVALALVLADGSAMAGETGGQSLEDALSGFDSGEEKRAAPPAPAEEAPAQKPWLELTGAFTASSSFNYAHQAPAPGKTDYRGLSRLRGRLDLWLDADLPHEWKARVGALGYHDLAYSIKGREDYTPQTLDAYENEGRLKEAYVGGSILENLDVKIGRQIVVWGKSDNIRVTDILNPMDIREPGMVDIEDVREPIAMSRLDWYLGKWSVTAIAVHEIKFNFLPANGSDFYPLSTPMPKEDIPASTGANAEYAVAISGVFPGFDAAFYLADFYDDAFSLKSALLPAAGAMPAPPGAAPAVMPFTLAHNRLKMAGFSMNKALGNFLAKAEGAWFDGYKFPLTGDKKFQRVDGLLGVEYTGFSETMISLEAAARSILGYESSIAQAPMGVDSVEWQVAFRYTQDFMHQTLHLTLLASVMGLDGAGGAFERAQLKYDVMDSMSVTAGAAAFQAGDTPFFLSVEDNDRAFLEAKYSF